MTCDPLVYTVAEAAELLRVSRDVLYAAIRRGQVRALRLGRTLRISRAEVERLCADGEKAVQPGDGSPAELELPADGD